MWGMGINFGDLDNDGWLDFYVGTGNPSLEFLTPNRMFRNSGATGAACYSRRSRLRAASGICRRGMDFLRRLE